MIRVLLCTLDADFHALLAVSGASAPSVIRIRCQGLRGAGLASLLEKVWTEAAKYIERGAVVSVTERAIRLRGLPIGSGSPLASPHDGEQLEE